MFSVVRIRPSSLVTESLYCAGGYEPPLQWLVRKQQFIRMQRETDTHIID